MKDLTFGEQVKIILNRKGMTIKELAEQIQEETGKAMSRQNLTQRLGRDNFQEQDMRMIAKILGCPFRLSIFPTVNDEEFQIDEEALLSYEKKLGKKKKEEQEEDVYQQEFIFDEMMTASVAEMPAAALPVEDVVEEIEEEIVEEPAEMDEFEEDHEEEIVEEQEEAEEIEEEYKDEVVEEPVEAEEIEEEIVEQQVEEIMEEHEEEPVEEVVEEQNTAPVEEPEHKTERFRGGFFFRFGKNKKKDKKVARAYEAKLEPEEMKLDVKNETEVEVTEMETEESEQVIENTEVETKALDAEAEETVLEEMEEIVEESLKEETATELKEEAVEDETVVEVAEDLEAEEVKVETSMSESEKEVVSSEDEQLSSQSFMKELEKFEPIVKHQEENEDLKRGELNPYTGHEYQTNSVRMHPSKIGYVQVYDRTKHGWIDMTEWAFLGYQEKKKKQLGRNYEPPIYLD